MAGSLVAGWYMISLNTTEVSARAGEISAKRQASAGMMIRRIKVCFKEGWFE